MEQQEQDVSQGDPEPIYLDKVRVHKVALEGKVTGRLSWRVRLRDRIVRRISGGRIDEGEE